MTVYPLLPQPQAYGYSVGVLLLNFLEPHVPGDTAHAGTYKYPVLFKVVEAAHVDAITNGDRSVEGELIAAVRELEAYGVKAISSDCGFMLNYQDALRSAVSIPVFSSSLMQLPMIARTIKPGQKIAILTAFKHRLTKEVLALSGLSPDVEVVISSIETSPEFSNISSQPLDTSAFRERLESATAELFESHSNIGAVLLECALYTPYAAPLQKRFGVPVYDFVSLIDYAYSVTHRRTYEGIG